MNAYRKIATPFTFALAAIVLSVGSALAQPMDTVEWQGKFTLSFEAHWGLATLPAGHYTFEVHNLGRATRVEVRGEGKESKGAIILPMTHQLSPSANTSELVCIRHGDTGTVRALVLTDLGETLYFAIPKNVPLYAHNGNAKTRTLVAQAPELIQRISVEATER
jgi:hypothetical protein